MELLVRLVEHDGGQTHAAKRLGVHPSTVGRWMRGECAPHLADAAALVDAVSVLDIPASRAALILLGVHNGGVLAAIDADPDLLPGARISLARQYDVARKVMDERRREMAHARAILRNGSHDR